MTTLVAVQFHSQELLATLVDGVPYVAVKPICENLGIDWDSQNKRIKRHPVLSKGTVIMTAPSNGGMQEMVMLPIKLLHGWLFGIDSNRVSADVQDLIVQYQEECFDVLANHFMGGGIKKPLPEYTNEMAEMFELFKKNVNNPDLWNLTIPQDRQIKARIEQLAKEQIGSSETDVKWAIMKHLYRTEDDHAIVIKRDYWRDISRHQYKEVCSFLKITPISDDETMRYDFMCWLLNNKTGFLFDLFLDKPQTVVKMPTLENPHPVSIQDLSNQDRTKIINELYEICRINQTLMIDKRLIENVRDLLNQMLA